MSAGFTARSALAAVGGDRVRALQHALYRAAKADPDRRFHALSDKIFRRMCWTGRGRMCAAIAALLALTMSAWRTPGSTGCPGCSASWPRS